MVYTTEDIKRITVPIAKAYGIRRLSLFGSYARGEATEDSDVDILINKGNLAGGWTIGGLYADLCEALGKELDMVTVTGVDADFLSRIKEDEVVLYEQAG